jgi:hypothetical protein
MKILGTKHVKTISPEKYPQLRLFHPTTRKNPQGTEVLWGLMSQSLAAQA